MLGLGPRVHGGGSGLNVIVVENQSSSNSMELGNYYCERRQVPPQNVLRTSWTGGNISWGETDFETVILNPLLSMISARSLTNQIDYVVLSMDFPFQVIDASGLNSTTADLFYGFKPDGPAMPGLPASCNLPDVSTNSYVGSESIFRFSQPSAAATNSFLAVMITSETLQQAKATIDQGVSSDNTFPTQTVILGHSDDPFRNVRYVNFDDAIFDTRLRTNYSILQSNLDSPFGLTNLLGYENGYFNFPISPNSFVPGAMADSLTSYGGLILGGSGGHTTAMDFLNAGASGSYGTVVEPCNYLEKFPAPQDYFYQARGFSLSECYYQSVTNPYQGIMVGEPLAAPFARQPNVSCNNLPLNARLSGTTNLSLQASSSDGQHPVQQLDVFLDGIFLQTVTNISPGANNNNIIYITLNGFRTNYTAPTGATIKSATSDIVARLNQSLYSISTKVQASAHGDRIELKSIDNTKLGAQVSVSVSNNLGGATPLLVASRATFLDSPARGSRSYTVTNIPQVGSYLELDVTKTNGQMVVVSLTNNASGVTISQFAQAFFSAINSNPSLQSSDGVSAENIVMHEDFAFAFGPDDHSGDFDIRPRSAGWPASQVHVRVTGSPNFTLTPSTSNPLDANVSDLYPRNHLYMTGGQTNLLLTFPLNTISLPDGYHELTAVAYEGSHVHTQKRFSQNVLIQNSSLSATFDLVAGGTNSDIGSTLQFSVVANSISKIELFSTGGSLGSVLGQLSATFSVAGTNLGIGLHPFYAIITGTTGGQYRTQTIWVRLLGTEPAFRVAISAPPPTLTWPATAGRMYDILSTTNLAVPFQLRDSVTVSNSLGQWAETNVSSATRFYRIRTSN